MARSRALPPPASSACLACTVPALGCIHVAHNTPRCVPFAGYLSSLMSSDAIPSYFPSRSLSLPLALPTRRSPLHSVPFCCQATMFLISSCSFFPH